MEGVDFNLPGVAAEDLEERYSEYARFCSASVPEPSERIQSITFIHNGEEWTATVGEKLRGTKTETRRRRGERVEVTSPLSDDATVLAIFPGEPYKVMTDARPVTPLRSRWENPFFAGKHAIRHEVGFNVS